MSNFVPFVAHDFDNLEEIFMDTNFDKKIFIKNFVNNCNKIQIK